jgi:hypothetical protein
MPSIIFTETAVPAGRVICAGALDKETSKVTQRQNPTVSDFITTRASDPLETGVDHCNCRKYTPQVSAGAEGFGQF